MRPSIASLVFVPLAFLAPAALAQKPKDLDKIVPPDALVRIEVDGLDAVKKAVADLVDAIMPGMGQMMIEGSAQQMMQQPGFSELDTTAPMSFTLLAGGQKLVSATLKNPDAFAKALKDMADDGNTNLVAGDGASLVTIGADVKVDDLAKGGRAKGPAEPGTVRGFVNMKGIYAKYHDDIDGALAMFQMMAAQSGGTPPDFGAWIKGLATDSPRIDFALTPSKAGLEIATAFTPTPEAKGFVASIAKAQPASGANKFIGVVPANSVMVVSGRLTSEMATGFSELMVGVVPGVDDATKTQLKSAFERMVTLTAGDAAIGVAGSADGKSLTGVGAMNCSDKAKYRAIVQELAAKGGPIEKFFTAAVKGAKVSTEFKPATETIEGVEVDQVQYTFATSEASPPATQGAMAAVKQMFSEPMRVAYPPGQLVLAYGANNGDALKAALGAVKSGSTSSPAAKALPTGAAFAMSINLVEYLKFAASMAPPDMPNPLSALKNAGPGKDYATVTIGPALGAAEFRVNIPSGGIQQIVQTFQGGMGAAPK
jgi:hypothetical protein